MAKKKTLEQAIDELMDNYESALKVAVEYASNEAVRDVYEYSINNCLLEYYDNYDPTSYERTDYLWNAILPYAEPIKKTKGKFISKIGVEYDPSKLDNIYYGSDKYSPADGSWILNNYLNGIHPYTKFDSQKDQYIYYEIYDPVSPTKKMNSYLNQYIKTFDSNLLISLVSQVMKKI